MKNNGYPSQLTTCIGVFFRLPPAELVVLVYGWCVVCLVSGVGESEKRHCGPHAFRSPAVWDKNGAWGHIMAESDDLFLVTSFFSHCSQLLAVPVSGWPSRLGLLWVSGRLVQWGDCWGVDSTYGQTGWWERGQRQPHTFHTGQETRSKSEKKEKRKEIHMYGERGEEGREVEVKR